MKRHVIGISVVALLIAVGCLAVPQGPPKPKGGLVMTPGAFRDRNGTIVPHVDHEDGSQSVTWTDERGIVRTWRTGPMEFTLSDTDR